MLAAACSGRLTEDWREQNPSQCYTQQPIAKTSDEDDLPEIPDSWCWTPIGEISEIRGGIQKQPKRTPKKNAFPYLRVANVLRGRLDLSQVKQMELFEGELETYRLEAGDLLVVEGNGSLTEIGRSAIWGGEIENCVHQNHIIRVRLRGCIPDYVDAFWNSSFGTSIITERAVTTSGLYSLSTKKVASIPLPLPPFKEQREIIRRTRTLFAVADNIARKVVTATLKADKLTQSILAKAFGGELVPTEAELARREGGSMSLRQCCWNGSRRSEKRKRRESLSASRRLREEIGYRERIGIEPSRHPLRHIQSDPVRYRVGVRASHLTFLFLDFGPMLPLSITDFLTGSSRVSPQQATKGVP